jgi:carboxymethylenebutenolidase
MPVISIPAHDGGNFSAYIALPKKTPAPCVIAIQEIFGVNQEMRDKCDALAAQGYIAVAPDLFWRIEPGIQLVDSVPEQLQRAFNLLGEFDVEKGIDDLKATLGFMRKYTGVDGKVGCVGYCLGGKLAYMMATRSDVDASVAYYGVNIENMLDEHVGKPLLMHIAEEDQYVSKDAQEKIKAALAKNKNVTIYSYPGVEHAFARGQGMHYDEQAAQLANKRTAEFFALTIGRKLAA